VDIRRRRLVEELFHEAADLAPAERNAFLDRMCGSDEDLRRQVTSLLAADATDHGLLQAAVNRVVGQLPPAADERWELIGTRVGPYLITGFIGTGGMGAVYRAVRMDDFQMQVAVKLLKRGTDTETALKRFRSERQILANLQHPNIARLFDGGATEAGLPYFVMEYVDGTPLLEYAAPLSIRQRLGLFQSICSAVEYAHQHRIVHRDIKPANILVTRDGMPKLLDFGIAKLIATNEDTRSITLTLASLRVMTPDYASPEQVRGEPVTLSSDIYSLGAVLYELLTGQRAHHVEMCSPNEIEKEICTREPKKPSAVARDLNTDLDNIVLKAMRKEPERRYRSVAELADDLDRFLHDLPVKARKESLLYRVRKFLKRKRGLIAAAAAGAGLVFVLVTGLPRLESPVGVGVRSVAVLPLVNLSGDNGQEYFADGMTDALIGDLARIRTLHVISRNSAMPYKGVRQSGGDIARKLGVATIAEGSVLRTGNRVRISLKLVDAPDDRPIWSGNYEGELNDIVAIQRDMREAIVGELHVTLTAPEQAYLARTERVNLAAYDAYLKGRHQYLTEFTQQSMQKAIDLFQSSLAIDPGYAPAYEGLAECYSMASGRFYPPVEMMPKAEAAVLKAISIDDLLGGAHATLAYIRSVYEYDRAEAEKGFRRAIELEPSNAEARVWYAEHLAGMGRFDEAVAEIEHAHQLDPVSPGLNGYIGLILYFTHRYDQLIERMQPLAETHPDMTEPHYYLGVAFEQKREWAKAIAELEKPGVVFESSLGNLGHVYAMSGRTAEARQMLQRLTAPSQEHYVAPYTIAVLCAGLGEKDEAFVWLRKSVEERSEDVALVYADPRFQPLYSDPRFAEILHSVGVASK